MKILVLSALELPYTIGARYTGLERLAYQFAEQFALLGHQVTLMAHKDTPPTKNISLLPCDGYENGETTHAELRAFLNYQREFYNFDAIWDITHLHLPARFMNLPFINIFHANPEYAFKLGYVKAPYNLVSWSKWGIREIAKYYKRGQPTQNGGQKAVYQETIMVDPEVYKPSGIRGNRFLTIGRMSSEKGNLNAAILCKELGLEIDIAGGRGSEVKSGAPPTEYEQAIIRICDGKQIIYHGEVSDEEKISLMQNCKALLYMTDYVEITSHKVQEAMLCGAPVIVPNRGGIPEIVSHEIDGFLCSTEQDYVMAIQNINKLDPVKTREQLAYKYNPKIVAEGYINLLQRVVKGERW